MQWSWQFDAVFFLIIVPGLMLCMRFVPSVWPHFVRGWNAWLDFCRL